MDTGSMADYERWVAYLESRKLIERHPTEACVRSLPADSAHGQSQAAGVGPNVPLTVQRDRIPEPGEEHIPAAYYADLWDYHRGCGGEGPHAYKWSDKPHRLVFDLTCIIASMRENVPRVVQRIEPDPLGEALNSGDGSYKP